MKTIYQKMTFAGANLLALSANAQDASLLKPVFGATTGQTQAMTESDLRMVEAAHLKVPRSCKWGHAAFDPIQVGTEEISSDIAALHLQMDNA